MYEIDKLGLVDSHKELRKCVFESKLKNMYDINSLNDMNNIHDNKVNIIVEFNLLHDILNTSEHTQNIKSHHFPILHGYMNTRKGEEKCKSF